jgi:hypothetical protein
MTRAEAERLVDAVYANESVRQPGDDRALIDIKRDKLAAVIVAAVADERARWTGALHNVAGISGADPESAALAGDRKKRLAYDNGKADGITERDRAWRAWLMKLCDWYTLLTRGARWRDFLASCPPPDREPEEPAG